jgi:hypothetical protein
LDYRSCSSRILTAPVYCRIIDELFLILHKMNAKSQKNDFFVHPEIN